VDSLPDTARDEAGEQRDVVVGNVVVSDAAVATIANMTRTEQIVLAQFHMSPIGDGRMPVSPVTWQGEACELVDDVSHRGLQLVGVDMLSVEPSQHLCRDALWSVTRGLVWAEVAAIAEDGEEVAQHGLSELRIGAGRRSEVTRVSGPVLGML